MASSQFFPKVSIVIPVYNGSNYMREAIDSALGQTYRNIEVIIVNDGSKDEGKTEAIAKSYGDGIRYFSKENGGVATALNLGIQRMTGEYFSWLSHDDVYYPDKIELQVNYLAESGRPETILYGDYDIINEHSELTDSLLGQLPHFEPDQFIYELIMNPFLHGCTLLVPALCFKTIGVFDERLITVQDYELWIKMAARYSFVHLPQKHVKSRHHSEQGTNKVSRIHMEEVETLNLWFMKRLPPDNISKVYSISKSDFFLRLAGNYLKRNLRKSYCAALDEAVRYSKKESITAYLKTKLKTGLRRRQIAE